jgi:hypothetical protein
MDHLPWGGVPRFVRDNGQETLFDAAGAPL